MISIANRYEPDSVSPPGDTLMEALKDRGMSQLDLAERVGMTRKHVNRILAGEAPITPETALRLERALGIPARFWNNREQQYRDFLARRSEQEELGKRVEWLRHFPIRRMVELKWIASAKDRVGQLQELLNFFGVANPQAWDECWKQVEVAYRRSGRFESDPYALAAWLRKGEIEAQKIACDSHDPARLRAILTRIRGLTTAPPSVFQSKIQELCAACGVAAVFVPELPKTASGATRWLAPSKALLQLSLRYKTDDHLWFTFFHEAGHILLHRKKAIFLESDRRSGKEEGEADQFAADMLIPQQKLDAFIAARAFSTASIRRFGQEHDIAPGIVVGQLQHKKAVPFSHFNGLKQRFDWSIH